MMDRALRIGTRESQLAVWQARKVQSLLQALNVRTELIYIKSTGDMVLDKPLHQVGGTGLFTKALDDALLADEIDMAVHSLKDLPTQLLEGLIIGAVLEREDPRDVLVCREGTDFIDDPDYKATIATGSLRRKAQWLSKYPNHQLTGLRGNVPTRLEKLYNSNWDGAIFAWAGLKRLEIFPEQKVLLDWMVPAPAQGVIAIACRENDDSTKEAITPLNHEVTERCSTIERIFLRDMQGGCTAPIGAHTYVMDDGRVELKTMVLSVDGKDKVNIALKAPYLDAMNLGGQAATLAKERGAEKIIASIKPDLLGD